MFKKDVAILDIGSMCMTVMVAERGVNGTFKIKGKGAAVIRAETPVSRN